jgi:Flp pilus assembly pilin Flp
MPEALIRFLWDDGAATAIEYSLILGLVVLAIVGSIQFLGQSLSSMYLYVSSNVTSSMGGG